MYSIENLNLKRLNSLKKLNMRRTEFNNLNEDFFSLYSRSNIITRYFLRKQVSMLRYNFDYIGYLWFSRCRANSYKFIINSLYIDKNHYNSNCALLLNRLPSNSMALYECKEVEENHNFLLEIGFRQEEGTYELIKNLTSEDIFRIDEKSLEFVEFKRGIHESTRCSLQNDIFMNKDREPLTINDIILDAQQSYYVRDWCILLKYKGEYIGYGQVIRNQDIPTIVNFGIIRNYRGMGFGEKLLAYLINLVYNSGYKQVKIRVNCENNIAYQLYRKKGFNVINHYYMWIYNK